MQRLKEDIKSEKFHNIYLLYGEEDYLKRMYRDNLKKAVLNDSDEMNYSYFEGNSVDITEIRNIADTLPFFSDYRIVIVENSGMFKSSNDFADYLSGMPDTTIILFVEKEIDKRNKLYKYVNKNGIAVEMNQMSAHETKSFVGMILKQNNKIIREKTAEYLLQHIDNSMINIKNELDKLIAYTEGRDEITIEDIDDICPVQITGRIFQMIDSVAECNVNQAMSLYHDLLQLRESSMSILYLLTRHFNILLQIKSLNSTSKSEIAKKIGIPPFATGKYMSQAKRFNITLLKEMLNQCIDTEYRFKRGLLGDQIGVELLLIQFINMNSNDFNYQYGGN